MALSAAGVAEPRKVKYTAVLFAVLTILLQIHTISASHGSSQCSINYPCTGDLCCGPKGLCGSTAAECGAGCINGPCTPSTSNHGFQDFHTISASHGSSQCSINYPCTDDLCCGPKGLCGSTAAECGAGCINGPCTPSTSPHGFQDFHTISASHGSSQCSINYPCTDDLCCGPKGLCGSTVAECGAGCINGPCTPSTSPHGFQDFHIISASHGSSQCSINFPCTDDLCCGPKGLCGSTVAECGAGCINGPCAHSTSPHHGFPDFSVGAVAEHSIDAEEKNDSKESNNATNLVTRESFDKVFPNRASFYTYESFVAAAKEFPAFGTTGTAVDKNRDVAAFFAHVHYETKGLVDMVEESKDSVDFCCAKSCLEKYPLASLFSCAPGKKYFARGPLKLTWNYNYGSASKALGADLVAEPELVSEDAILSFKSALWVWMKADPQQPSSHDVMSGSWSPSASDVATYRLPGFGTTINILKGGKECGHKSSAAAARIQNYIHIAKMFDISTGPHLACATMKPF